MPTPEVSGRAFLGLIHHLKETKGPGALPGALPQMPPSTREAFATRILHGSWYPYQAYVGLLTGLDARFGTGDGTYCRELGHSSGSRDLSTVFKVFRVLASTERLIRGCSKVWSGYYRDAGAMEAVRWDPQDTMLRISGFPEMAPVHCRLMEGWMTAAMNALGVEVLDGRETACSSRGAPHHEFACRWRKR